VTEVIQLRLASLFEPPQGTGGAVSGLRFGSEQMEPAPISDETEFDARTQTHPFARRPIRHPPETELPAADLHPPSHMAKQPLTPVAIQPPELRPEGPLAQPTPGSALRPSPEQSMPALRPITAKPSARRTPQQRGREKSTLLEVERRDEIGAASSRSAADNSTSQHLSPRIAPQSIETRPEQHPTRPAHDPDRSKLAQTPESIVPPAAVRPSDRSALQQRHTEQPVLVSRTVETSAEPPRSAGERESQSSPEQNIPHVGVEQIASREIRQSQNIPRTELSVIKATRYLTPTTVIVQPHVTPYVEPKAPAPAEPTAAPKPTPTIKVTIGRIEVRAIMPPAPPAPRTKPARTGPTLSLEDYLKQRNEGRR
jgi:hypothetical protein